jgi:tRNA A-37 threonylcarbamoyl transferase component Bud32
MLKLRSKHNIQIVILLAPCTLIYVVATFKRLYIVPRSLVIDNPILAVSACATTIATNLLAVVLLRLICFETSWTTRPKEPSITFEYKLTDFVFPSLFLPLSEPESHRPHWCPNSSARSESPSAMPSKTSPAAPSNVHPPLGTLIDEDNLELVEVLGIGGYGVVYRAVDTRSSSPKSYAVKCLMHTQLQQTSRQRQAHIREIALHQIASAHPNVVTLHRVIEECHLTYIIMDYANDGDLFSQILHNCRYLGDDFLIKHIFLQLLDAVEYCHSLGIYHRDLKPENILCFDGGLRIAITDFGLATTDKVSDEFRTGSIYHMSPGKLFRPLEVFPAFN